VSPLPPEEALPGVAAYIKAVYPGKYVTAWIPEQPTHNPLAQSIRHQKWGLSIGEHPALAKGSLSNIIRTEINGRRQFTVDINARNTLNAISFRYKVDEESTIMEGLEVLNYALTKQISSDTFAPNAINANGVRYFSALGGR
jgi:hypothetical protein